MRKNAGVVAFMTALMLTVSGCMGISSVDSLYSLPQPQEEFLQLQELIDSEIASGCEYSAPTAGSQRQSIQLFDIDGDGTQEALAFLRTNEQAPKICIYRNTGDLYELACTITGEGTGIGRVEYSDLDGNGLSELIVTWIMTTDLKLIKAYSLKDWSSAVMLSQSCTDYLVGDLNSDSRPEVVLLSFDGGSGKTSVFTADPAGEITQYSCPLSPSLKSADRFRISAVQGGVPAIFVEGSYNSETLGTTYLTDVFVLSGDRLVNILLAPDSQDSFAQRQTAVYSFDIDSDGVLDIPYTRQVYTQPGITAVYHIFDWYSYDATGVGAKLFSTYHCYNDGWYTVLPEEWSQGFTVRREQDFTGERSVTLSTADLSTGVITDKITIYTLTDENRAEKAALPGRFILFKNDATIYAASFAADTPDTEEQRQQIIDRFHLIYSEWNSGAV